MPQAIGILLFIILNHIKILGNAHILLKISLYFAQFSNFQKVLEIHLSIVNGPYNIHFYDFAKFI